MTQMPSAGKPRQFHWLALLALFLYTFAAPFNGASQVSAQQVNPEPPLRTQRVDFAKLSSYVAQLRKRLIDVVVVLDNSASMNTCWPWQNGVPVPDEKCKKEEELYNATDRANHRYSAARLLVKLADPADRLAFVSFDSVGTYIGPAELSPVGDGSALMAVLVPPGDYSSRGRTMIHEGLKKASSLLTQRSSDDAKRPGYILLLTDGVPYGPSGNEARDLATQKKDVTDTMQELNKKGVTVYPVQLCAVEGCATDPSKKAFDFLKNMNSSPAQVSSAGELASTFSQVYSRMKPDLHVIPGNNGHLEFTSEAKHGVSLIDVVTPASNPTTLRVGDNNDPGATVWKVQDNNITVYTAKDGVQTGRWFLDGGAGLFAVVHTLAYPEVAFPPANPADPDRRYVPSNKEVLVLAYFAGVPGSMQDLFINNEPFRPFTAGDSNTPALGMRLMPVFDSQTRYTLQIGRSAPGTLEIKRDFTFIADPSLPKVTTKEPEGCRAGEPCQLEASFDGSQPLKDLKGTVYINDPTLPAENSSVLVKALQCDVASRKCSDNSFVPEEDREYDIIYTLEARMASGEKRYFGDWAGTSLNIKPSISITGLTVPLDLSTQPGNGWQATVISTGKGDYGRLVATLNLTNDKKQAVSGVSAQLGPEMEHAQGTKGTTLLVAGLQNLETGTYSGEINFTLQSPPANPPKMPPPIPVTYVVGMNEANVVAGKLNFGIIPDSADRTATLNITRSVQILFMKATFPLVVTDVEEVEAEPPTCGEYGVIVDVGTQPPSGSPPGEYPVEFIVSSTRNIPPMVNCIGVVHLRGPDETSYAVTPNVVPWLFSVAQVNWKPLGGVVIDSGSSTRYRTDGEVRFGEITYKDEVARAQLEVEFTGSPPFTLVADSLVAGKGGTTDVLSDLDLGWAVLNPPTRINENHIYTLDVTLTVRRNVIDHEWWNGADYSGTLNLRVPELPDGTEGASSQSIKFSFRSTSWLQRNMLLVIIVILVLYLIVAWLKRLRTDQEPTTPGQSVDLKEPAPVPPSG
jgi:hypothetical protein